MSGQTAFSFSGTCGYCIVLHTFLFNNEQLATFHPWTPFPTERISTPDGALPLVAIGEDNACAIPLARDVLGSTLHAKVEEKGIRAWGEGWGQTPGLWGTTIHTQTSRISISSNDHHWAKVLLLDLPGATRVVRIAVVAKPILWELPEFGLRFACRTLENYNIYPLKSPLVNPKMTKNHPNLSKSCRKLPQKLPLKKKKKKKTLTKKSKARWLLELLPGCCPLQGQQQPQQKGSYDDPRSLFWGTESWLPWDQGLKKIFSLIQNNNKK